MIFVLLTTTIAESQFSLSLHRFPDPFLTCSNLRKYLLKAVENRDVFRGDLKVWLDLLVVIEIAMSETAVLAHYVLPCRSTYGSWSPEPADRIIPSPTDEYLLNIYSRMRQPVVEVEGEQKETGEIFTLLAHAMGLVPALPDSLYQAAGSSNLKTYRDALAGYLMEHPENMKKVPFIAAETLGKAIGSAHLASYFTGSLQRSPAKQAGAVAAGFEAGEDQGLALYQALIDHPEGVLVGVQDLRKNLGKLATGDGKIRLYTAEAEEGINKITLRRKRNG